MFPAAFGASRSGGDDGALWRRRIDRQMSRRRRAERRVPLADPLYQSVILASFINRVMLNGKKTVAQRAVYQALDQVGRETNRDAMEVFQTALRNVTPTVEVKPRRVGGATYQVPIEVPERRRNALAMRWLIRSGACAHRPAHALATGSRNYRRVTRAGNRRPPPRGSAPHGGGQQSLCPLPVVRRTE